MAKKLMLSLLTLVMVASLGMGVIYAQDGGDEEETECQDLGTVITETLGMTAEELRDALQDGQTLSEIAEAQGVATDDLALAIGNHHLKCASQRRANRPDGQFGGRGNDRGGRFGQNGPFGGDGVGPFDGDFGGRDFAPFGGRDGARFGANSSLIEAISEATGLSAEEIFTMMREDDMTLSEIITANGGDVDAIIADLVEQFETNLADRLNGNDSSEASAE